jgi:Flp pilus assembly protein TadG
MMKIIKQMLVANHEWVGYRKGKKPASGQSLVELALTLSLVLLLIAGLVDLSRAFFTLMALRDAAQEGASFGAINPTNTFGIESRVRSTSQDIVDLSDVSQVTVSISYTTGNACAAPDGSNGITLTVTYNNFTLITPFLGTIIGTQTIPISTSITDTILRPPC